MKYLLIGAFVFTSCTLIVDSELRNALDGGQAGGGVGGGATGGGIGGGSTGGGLGGGATGGGVGGGSAGGGFGGGMGGGAPYDGGTPCMGSNRPRLNCVESLLYSGRVHQFAVAAVSDGIVYGYGIDGGFHLEKLSATGSSSVIDNSSNVDPAVVRLVGEGPRWVMIKSAATGELQCSSSTSTAPVTLSGYTKLSAAISAAGEVLLASPSPNMNKILVGVDAGCPSSLTEMTATGTHSLVEAAHLADAGTSGFRLVSTNDTCTSFSMITLEGALTSTPAISPPARVQQVVVSNDSSRLLAMSIDVGCPNANQSSNLRSIASNGSIGGIPLLGVNDTHSAALSECGPGCVAHSIVFGSPAQIITAVRNDVTFEPNQVAWDPTCAIDSDSKVAQAFFAGKLHLFIGSNTGLRLLRCEVPPL